MHAMNDCSYMFFFIAFSFHKIIRGGPWSTMQLHGLLGMFLCSDYFHYDIHGGPWFCMVDHAAPCPQGISVYFIKVSESFRKFQKVK